MFQGALVAIVTPFRNGQVDEESLRRLIEFQIENGTNGIVPVGTTGESPTLSHAEHKRVVEITVEQVRGRVPVIAGAGSNNTAEAIELTAHAKKVGADAVLQITPYYNKPTPEGLYQHLKAIAKAAPMPIVVYSIQSRTGINVAPETMARLAQDIPEVVAVKEASGNVAQMAEIMRLCGDRITLLSGDDNLILPVLALGGKGVISVVSNILPRQVAELHRAWFDGDLAEARRRFYELLPVCKAMFIETNPIPVKTAMEMMGLLPSGELRLPMCPMSEANRQKLRQVLQDNGVL